METPKLHISPAYASYCPSLIITRIHRLVQDPTDAEVSDLYLLPGIEEEVGRLDVTVDDVAAVEVGEAAKDLTRKISEVLLVRYVLPFEGTAIHELKEDLDLGVVIVHVVTLHHVLVVNVAEDLDLTVDLSANGLLVVAVDDLESVESVGGTVNGLVDCAAAAAADTVEAFKLGERDVMVEGGGGRGGRRGGGGRERERDSEVGVAVGEREGEVFTAAVVRTVRRSGGGGRGWRLNGPHMNRK
ncbi:hypothetical protein Lal_00021794 [Lupinus albus]|nr:hypothetical protein Lal_00021794 [Lupinus albus]